MIGSHRKTIYEALGREPVHPFPARMAPGIALQVMSEMEESVRVLDPMMGSGTVLAMARSKGHKAIGFDIDPLAVLISKVWTTAFDPDEIREEANGVLVRARQNFNDISQKDAYPAGADEKTCHFVSYWFDGYARRQLSALSMSIARLRSEITRNVLWCAFSRLIICKQSGASLAMDLSHSRPHKTFHTAPSKPFNKFLSAVEHVIANGINKKQVGRGPAPSVGLGSALSLPLRDCSVDLVLTSPPYLNAIDYIRCSKFSLVWMGYSVAELRRLRSGSVGSEAARDEPLDDREVKGIVDGLDLKPTLDSRQEQILRRFIGDMRGAIGEVGRVLSRTGKAVYVVGENTLRGTYIRTSIIVSKLAQLAGLTLKKSQARTLPANRRYMPPPTTGGTGGKIDARMRREVVLTFVK
jgi:hypothetical protein